MYNHLIEWVSRNQNAQPPNRCLDPHRRRSICACMCCLCGCKTYIHIQPYDWVCLTQSKVSYETHCVSARQFVTQDTTAIIYNHMIECHMRHTVSVSHTIKTVSLHITARILCVVVGSWVACVYVLYLNTGSSCVCDVLYLNTGQFVCVCVCVWVCLCVCVCVRVCSI